MNTEILEKPLTYEEERGKPLPSLNHGIIQTNLILQFAQHREYRIVSELTLKIGGKDYTPDLSIYPQRAMDLEHDISKMTELPLSVVEIFSPQQGSQEVMDKVEIYLTQGVKSCWIVSPPLATISIRTADGYRKSFASGVIKDPATGLTADLGAVFA